MWKHGKILAPLTGARETPTLSAMLSNTPRFVVLLPCLVLTAYAQSEKPTLLPEVTVSATRVEHDSFDLPVSIDAVGRRVIRQDNPQINLSESLNRVPGVVVQNRQNYAQDLQISSRGFGSRATFGVRGIRLIADGIPATMPDGQGQAASFNLSSAERIEVLRGPFSSLYGNASGGVIQIFTADGPPEPTLSGNVYAGSHHSRKYGLQFGGTRDSFNYLIDASRFEMDGYREHSAARRDHVNGKFKLDAGARGRFTFVVNALDQPETLDPLGLTADQVAQNRRQPGTNALAFNTRKSITQNQAGVVYDLPLSSRDKLEARLYAGDRQVTQYLAIPTFVQAAPTHSGGVVDLDRGYRGAGLRWTRDMTLANAPLILSAGADYDRMAERRRGFINDFGVAGALKRDEDDTVSNRDLYAQAEWAIAPRWNLLAGVRYSRVEFESRDYFIAPGNPDDSGTVDFVRTTPVIGATYRLAPTVNLYANAGKGFETPTFAELAYRPGGATGLNFALKPARSTHYETGVKALLGPASRVNVALFLIDVKDEIVVNASSGGRTVFANAGETRRKGLELLWEGRYARAFEAAIAYTYLDARFEQPFTSGGAAPVSAGNRLPGVPPYTLYGELVWRHAGSGFHAGLEGRRNGRVYVNDANSEFASSYTVWNIRAGFEQRARNWRFTEFVRVDNVTARRYIGSVIVSEANGRFYEPAPERTFMAGVNAELKF
jgi:iron complex outermembrane receptor protein